MRQDHLLHSPTAVEPPSPSGDPAPIRVLLVDDNPDDRHMARVELQRSFPQVRIQEIDNRQALEAGVRAGRFDVVVTDYQLGWMTGLQVLEAVKQAHAEKPVVMFTGSGSQEVAVNAMKRGLDDYVVKSSRDMVRLSAAVRSALTRAAQRRRALDVEQRLQNLLNRLNVGVFRADLYGRFLDCNPAFLRLIGAQTLEEAQDYGPARHVLWTGGAPSSLDLLGEAGQSIHRKVTLTRPDGAPTSLSVAEVVVQVEGRLLIDGLVEELTQAKQAATRG